MKLTVKDVTFVTYSKSRVSKNLEIFKFCVYNLNVGYLENSNTWTYSKSRVLKNLEISTYLCLKFVGIGHLENSS